MKLAGLDFRISRDFERRLRLLQALLELRNDGFGFCFDLVFLGQERHSEKAGGQQQGSGFEPDWLLGLDRSGPEPREAVGWIVIPGRGGLK